MVFFLRALYDEEYDCRSSWFAVNTITITLQQRLHNNNCCTFEVSVESTMPLTNCYQIMV